MFRSFASQSISFSYLISACFSLLLASRLVIQNLLTQDLLIQHCYEEVRFWFIKDVVLIQHRSQAGISGYSLRKNWYVNGLIPSSTSFRSASVCHQMCSPSWLASCSSRSSLSIQRLRLKSYRIDATTALAEATVLYTFHHCLRYSAGPKDTRLVEERPGGQGYDECCLRV